MKYRAQAVVLQNVVKELREEKSADIKNMTVFFIDDLETNRKNLKAVYDTRPHTFCIEDISNNDTPAASYQLMQFLYAYFPEKAPWEK